MFKYFVFFALLAFAFAAPEAKPEPQYYGHGYVSPYAYGAHAYSGYAPYSGYYGYGHGYPYYGHYGYY